MEPKIQRAIYIGIPVVIVIIAVVIIGKRKSQPEYKLPPKPKPPRDTIVNDQISVDNDVIIDDYYTDLIIDDQTDNQTDDVCSNEDLCKCSSGCAFTGLVNTKKGVNLNIRKEPGTNYEIIGKYESGSKVTLCWEDDGWFKNLSPIGGYVSADYIKRLSGCFKQK